MMRKTWLCLTILVALGGAGYYLANGGLVAVEKPRLASESQEPAAASSGARAGDRSPPRSADGLDRTARSEPKAVQGNSELRSAKEIDRYYDNLKIQALADYVTSGERSDAEAAYMILFNAVIEHDLFQQNETIADRYLNDHPFGAVTPLARAVKSMALAGRADFAGAARTYAALVAEVGSENTRFAWSFGDSLGRQAVAAGDYGAARQIYHGIGKKFPDATEIQHDVTLQLGKIELVGQPAPSFEELDLDGKKVSLADYHGKTLLIDFWATWCSPCVAELPNVRAVYDRYRSRGFDVLSISLDQDLQLLREFLSQQKLPWRQVVNPNPPERDIAARYGVERIPATFLITGDGRVQRVDLRGDGLDPAVAASLEGKSAARRVDP